MTYIDRMCLKRLQEYRMFSVFPPRNRSTMYSTRTPSTHIRAVSIGYRVLGGPSAGLRRSVPSVRVSVVPSRGRRGSTGRGSRDGLRSRRSRDGLRSRRACSVDTRSRGTHERILSNHEVALFVGFVEHVWTSSCTRLPSREDVHV